jgi:hypothetical protein
MNVVPFKANHLAWVTPDVSAITQETAAALLGDSYLFSAVDDRNRVVASFGFSTIWPGVYDVWFMSNELLLSNKLFVVRACKRILEQFIAHARPHRLQALVRKNFGRGHSFAKFFGFEKEAELIKFGPMGEDFVMYRILP